MTREVAAYILLTVVLVSADDSCDSFWCFDIFSRKVNSDLDSLNISKPVPIEDLIRQAGYPVETHEIKTEDGYRLTYHRIPGGKGSVPVLLQHGLLAASSSWVLSEHSLAFTLANAGFDVWLGNARGNTYSRKHATLDPDKDKKAFWDFSWHEMGYFDLPASIDYILQETGRDKIFYIGHSMGTTMYFVLGASRPEYMDKVHAAVMLAPVAFPWNMKSPLANLFTRLNHVIYWIVKALGVYEVLPYNNRIFWLDQYVCSNSRFQFICRDILFYIGGWDEKEFLRVSLSKIFQYVPAGASYKEFRHFRQISEEGTDFQQFDYGYLKNFRVYGSFYPPVYNLTLVRSPMYIYYGMNDWLAVPKDVFHAVKHLPNVKRVTKVPYDQFTHLDFMWALDAKTLLYDDIISTIKNNTFRIYSNVSS